jgi:hypothetical protein
MPLFQLVLTNYTGLPDLLLSMNNLYLIRVDIVVQNFIPKSVSMENRIEMPYLGYKNIISSFSS